MEHMDALKVTMKTGIETEMNERTDKGRAVHDAQNKLRVYLMTLIDEKMALQSSEINQLMETTTAELKLETKNSKVELVDEIIARVSSESKLRTDLRDGIVDDILKDLGTREGIRLAYLNDKIRDEMVMLRAEVNAMVRNEVSAQIDAGLRGDKLFENARDQIVSTVTSDVFKRLQWSGDGETGRTDALLVTIREEISRSIEQALALYDADKTAKPDYALESAGNAYIS